MERPYEQLVKSAAVLAAIVLAVAAGGGNTMTGQEYVRAASTHVAAFEDRGDPSELKKAYQLLVNAQPTEETSTEEREELRSMALVGWLELLDVIDRWRDPDFDPDEEVFLSISAAPGEELGADEQEALQKARAENAERAERHRIQIRLRRADERATEFAGTFILHHYAPHGSDQQAYREAVEAKISNPVRRERLLSLLPATVAK